jgi:hypothetical protein
MTIKLPDVLVTGWQHTASDGGGVPQVPGQPCGAYDAQFRGGVVIAASHADGATQDSSSGRSGRLLVGSDVGVFDTSGNPSWGLDRIDDRSGAAATGHDSQMVWDNTAQGGGGTGKATFQDMWCPPAAASAQGELQTYMQYELTHTLVSGGVGDDRPQSFSFDPSFGGSGDDLLIGGATSYDEASSASPISTGDLADWQSNYGTGGTAAAPYKMHLIGHTGAGSTGSDSNTYQGMTVVDGVLMAGVDNVDLKMFDGFDLV